MARPLTKPHKVPVQRTALRQKQRQMLRRARGSTVLVISAADREEEKLLVDQKYFDELVERLRAVMETLEITMDRSLFEQVLRAAPNLENRVRRGKLYSFEEAFR